VWRPKTTRGSQTHDFVAMGLREREGERNIPVSERVVGDEMERVIRERERKIKLDGASDQKVSDF